MGGTDRAALEAAVTGPQLGASLSALALCKPFPGRRQAEARPPAARQLILMPKLETIKAVQAHGDQFSMLGGEGKEAESDLSF